VLGDAPALLVLIELEIGMTSFECTDILAMDVEDQDEGYDFFC
jgi:hypothetical protein